MGRSRQRPAPGRNRNEPGALGNEDGVLIVSRLLVPLICAALAAGCTLPGRTPTAEPRAWLLQATDAGDADVPGEWPCVSLRVTAAQSAPGFHTSRMLYMDEPHRLDHFAYHTWADVPAAMIAELVQQHLTRLGIFGTVLAGTHDVRADYRLDLKSARLLQLFENGASRVSFDIDVALVEQAERSLVARQAFSYSQDATSADPQGGVNAANVIAGRFLADVVQFTTEAIGPVDCSPNSRP